MNDQTPEERFNAFLEADAERWRKHEAEVEALKLTVSALLQGLIGQSERIGEVTKRLQLAEKNLPSELHPAAGALLRDVRERLDEARRPKTIDGRPPFHGVMR